MYHSAILHHVTDKHMESIGSRCRRTLRGEGHSAAGWDIGESVIAADCGVQSLLIRVMGCCYLRCVTCVIAISHCKLLLVMFM